MTEFEQLLREELRQSAQVHPDPAALAHIRGRAEGIRIRRRLAGAVVALAAVVVAATAYAVFPRQVAGPVIAPRPSPTGIVPGPTAFPSPSGKVPGPTPSRSGVPSQAFGWAQIPTPPAGYVGVTGLGQYVWTGTEMVTGQWMAGGAPSLQISSATYAYNPMLRTWRTLDPYPLSGPTRPPAVWTGQQIVVAGAVGGDGKGIGLVEALDPASGHWRRLADSPQAGQATHAVWTGSRAVFAGLSTLALYDPATDSWTSGTPPPRQLALSDAVWLVANGRVYVISDLSMVYDPARDTWQRIPSPPVPMPVYGSESGVAAGDRLLIWGSTGTGSQAWTSFERGAAYDLRTGTWRLLDTGPPYRSEGIPVWTGTDVFVVATMGVPADSKLVTAIYEVGLDTWRAIPGMPDVYGPTAGCIWTGTQLLVLGASTARDSGFQPRGITYTMYLLPASP